MAEPKQLGSLDSEKWLDIRDFANFTVAHFVAKCYTVNARDGALTTLPFQKGGTGEVPFDNSITGNFTIYQDRLQIIYCTAIRAHRSFRMVFYNFSYYFLGKHGF